MAELVIHLPGTPGSHRVPLGLDPVTIGREEGCEVVLAEGSISKHHLRIQPEDGRYVLEDLNSKNGTFVNGTPVRRRLLITGDEIYAGHARIVFHEAGLELQDARTVRFSDPPGERSTIRITPRQMAQYIHTRPTDLDGHGPRAVDALHAIYRLSLELPHLRSRPALGEKLVNIVSVALEADVVCLFDARGNLWFGSEPEEQVLARAGSRVREWVQDVLKRSEALLKRELPKEMGIRSCALWPLSSAAGDPQGVLLAANSPHRRRLTGEDVRFGTAVATVAGSMLRNAQLMGRMERTIELLEVAAHDIRSPLAGVALAMDMISRHIDAGALETAQEELGATQHTLAGLDRLLRDLLSHEAIRAGRVRLRRVQLDPTEELLRLARPFQTLARYQQRDFEVALDPGLPLVAVDPVRLRQIVDNLLTNAFRYSGADGAVRFNAFQEDDHLVLTVADSGPGIPPDQRQQVFRPFVRGVETEGVNGSGLGLAIVDTLVRLHKGTIQVTEATEGGACFIVRLPLQPNGNGGR